MFGDRFDGLDLVLLVVPDVAPLLSLYGGSLGFAVESDGPPETPGLARLLNLPDEVTRVVHLGRGAGAGGAVVLVESPGSGPATLTVPGTRRGVYALDFYLRDAAATEQALVDDGWAFTSEAVHYDLPGTTIPVRERMLVQPHSDLLHAMVQHRPGGTRSVLGEDADGRCSEVVAVVVLTGDLAGARAFAADASAGLGGREYFAGTFDGPAIEEMLRFGAGEGLEASLFRGPASRNARLEFARPVAADGTPLPLADAPAGRRVVPGLLVDDLDAVLERWRESAHGEVAVVEELVWQGVTRRAARFDTAYDVSLLLVDGGTSAR